MNILSLPLKLEELEFLLSTLGVTIHIIILTETWVSSHDIKGNSKKKLKLNNYQSFHNCREDQRGGGVACYVHKSVSARKLEVFNTHNVQFLIIDLIELNLRIGVCYRPPQRGNTETFLNALNALLGKHRNFVLMGDMNIDLLSNNDPITKSYLETLSYLYFRPINKVHADMATRIDHRRSSYKIIDHVVSDLSFSLFHHFAVNDNCLSDHRTILINVLAEVHKHENQVYLLQLSQRFTRN